MYSIMSSANSDSCTSLPILILFTYFSSLIALAVTSKTMGNKSGENWHPWLVLELIGNAFSISPPKIFLLWFCTNGLNYVEVGSFYTHFLESFQQKLVFNFVKSFFCIYWDYHKLFILFWCGVSLWLIGRH